MKQTTAQASDELRASFVEFWDHLTGPLKKLLHLIAHHEFGAKPQPPAPPREAFTEAVLTRHPELRLYPGTHGGGAVDLAIPWSVEFSLYLDPLSCPVEWLPEARCVAVGVSGFQLAPDPIFIEQRREWAAAGRPAPTKAGLMRAWA